MLKFNNQPLKWGTQIISSKGIYLSRIAKDFIEFNLDNGYTLGYTADSIDRYCSAISDILEKEDLEYFLSHNPQFGTVNLIDPEKYRGTAYGGLTWSADGALGNGVNGYIDTGFNPSLLSENQKFQLDDASLGGIVYSKTPETSWQRNMIGGSQSSLGIMTWPANLNRINNANLGNAPFPPDGLGIGTYVASRSFSTEFALIFNDNSIVQQHPSSQIPNSNITILKREENSYSENGLTSFFAGASLTYNQTQRKRTAFNQLLIENNLTPIS